MQDAHITVMRTITASFQRYLASNDVLSSHTMVSDFPTRLEKTARTDI